MILRVAENYAVIVVPAPGLHLEGAVASEDDQQILLDPPRQRVGCFYVHM